MAIDNTFGPDSGRLYVAWVDASNGYNINVSHSTDHGQNWSSPVVIIERTRVSGPVATMDPILQGVNDPPSPSAPFVQAPVPAVGPDGTVYVVYLDVEADGSDGSPGGIYFAKSVNGGSSFSAAQQIAPIPATIWPEHLGSLYVYSDPTIAVGPSGRIYVAYTENDAGDYNIYYVCSTNGGYSWSPPVIATQTTNGHQFSPWLTASLSGIVSLVYYQGSSNSVDVYLAESYNGQSFYGSDVRVTPNSMNPVLPGIHLGSEYIGIASFPNGNVFPVWTDFRLGADENIYGALYNSYTRLAYSNKTMDASATWYNNNHTLERGGFSKLHEVFSSGGEIFYRRSSDNGSSWEVTTRLSTGNGANDCQSIASTPKGGSSDWLQVVWQRKISDYIYDIWWTRSTDGGASWSASAPLVSNVTVSYNQSNQGAGQGPTPVIASFCYGTQQQLGKEDANMAIPSYKFLVVYAAQDGLHYRTATDVSSWIVPSPDIVPGSGGWYSTIWHPSLATYNSTNCQANLFYDDRYTAVWSQIYDGTNWTNRLNGSFTGSYDRCGSIAVDYANSYYSVWSGWNGSQYTIRFRSGNASGVWSSWEKEWYVSGVNSFYPAITYYNKGGGNPFGLDIVWWTGANEIRQKKYYGVGDTWVPSDPLTNLLASNAMSANLTHETSSSGTPQQLWTSVSVSPYSIVLSSSGLPKSGGVIAGTTGEVHRAAEIANKKDHSILRVELGRPIITTTSGMNTPVSFKQYDYNAPLALSTMSIFDYLQTEQTNIPADASSISFSLTIVASSPDTLSGGKLNTDKKTAFTGIDADVIVKDATSAVSLLSSGKSVLVDAKGLHSFSKSFALPVDGLRGKSITVMPSVKISGKFAEEDLAFGLVNISIGGTTSGDSSPEVQTLSFALPSDVNLGQNYPNPFNPMTTIAYRVTRPGEVSLKVFDVLGREVVTLVNSEKAEGVHSEKFDASHLSSGLYFYQLVAPGVNETRKMLIAK